MQKLLTRWTILSLITVSMALGGCSSHQSEDAAREEVKVQEELRIQQEATDAAANEELRRSEK